MKFEWEKISGDFTTHARTWRAKVFGGWIVETDIKDKKDRPFSCSMVFVPDPKHLWCLTEKDILMQPIETLKINKRTYNCLFAEGIKTIGELLNWSERDLLRLPNFGRVSLRSLLPELERLNLRLKHNNEI